MKLTKLMQNENTIQNRLSAPASVHLCHTHIHIHIKELIQNELFQLDLMLAGPHWPVQPMYSSIFGTFTIWIGF